MAVVKQLLLAPQVDEGGSMLPLMAVKVPPVTEEEY